MSTAHFFKQEKVSHFLGQVRKLKIAEQKLISIVTVTKSTPAALAPRHSPVDIAPQPEYISNNDSCELWGILPDVPSRLDLILLSLLGIPEDNEKKHYHLLHTVEINQITSP